MRKIVSLLFIASCFVASAQTAKDFFNRASNKYQDQEYAAAAVEYTRALELAPESAVLFNNRGLCYFKMEQWNKALDDYERALTLDPKYKQTYLNVGNVFIAKDDYEKALLSLDKALAVDSFYTPVYAKRAFVLYQLEDYKGALEYYDKAIEYAPVERPNLYNARGATQEKLGKYELAIADYDKTLSLEPQAYETFINRGILKTKLKKFEDAIADFTVAQSFAGMSGEGYYYRGLCRVGKLDAIRGTKEKHYVMDIQKNAKLLELACSDFEKAKQFSYGRAFEAYQEYCVDKGEEVAIDEEVKDTSAQNEEINPTLDSLITKQAEPVIEEVASVSTPFSITERSKLKQEIKAEILAELLSEYELVPKLRVVVEDSTESITGDSAILAAIDSSIIASDTTNIVGVDTNVIDSVLSDTISVGQIFDTLIEKETDSLITHVKYDAYRDSLVQIFETSSKLLRRDSGFYQAEYISEIPSFYYSIDTVGYLIKLTIKDDKDFVLDYIYMKEGDILMHISQYTDSDDDAEEPEIFQELSVFENNEIIYQRSADGGAPNSKSYVNDVEQRVLELVELTKPE